MFRLRNVIHYGAFHAPTCEGFSVVEPRESFVCNGTNSEHVLGVGAEQASCIRSRGADEA